MTRKQTVTNLALLIALIWSAGFILAAFFVPFYSTMSATSTPDGTTATTTSTDTLVGANGMGVFGVISIPLIFAVGVTWALLKYRKAPTRNLGRLAWILSASVALFTVLGVMTIGLFILPVAVALIVACATGAPMAKPINKKAER